MFPHRKHTIALALALVISKSRPTTKRPSGSYSSVETLVLGFVLAHAIGRPVAEYLQEKIWQPMGAEADAPWLVDNSGQETTLCCLNAVLRDYARLGLLLAHDGNWRGRQVIPAAWVLEATTVHLDQPHVWPGTATPNAGHWRNYSREHPRLPSALANRRAG